MSLVNLEDMDLIQIGPNIIPWWATYVRPQNGCSIVDIDAAHVGTSAHLATAAVALLAAADGFSVWSYFRLYLDAGRT